MLTELGSL